MDDARALIDKLGLTPHPEGGWYNETWRAADTIADRVIATAILFLLEKGRRSHWHRVDATEIWLWHGGSPLTLLTSTGDKGPIDTHLLGGDPLAGQMPQHVIAPGDWQMTRGGVSSAALLLRLPVRRLCFGAPGWSPQA